MAEELRITATERDAVYRELVPQLAALIEGEPDLVANLANVAAALRQGLGARVSWVGFYRRVGDELVLGPFQGKIACVRIAWGKGVCGTAAAEDRTVIVPDVDAFPGHIACDSASRSEIVVPIRRDGQIVAVLDLDSTELGSFDETDGRWLGEVAALCGRLAW